MTQSPNETYVEPKFFQLASELHEIYIPCNLAWQASSKKWLVYIYLEDLCFKVMQEMLHVYTIIW